MKLKINLHNFQSAARVAMIVGGTAAAVSPGLTPIVTAAGGAAVGIAAAWGQINALLHPHDPKAAQDAADAIAALAAASQAPAFAPPGIGSPAPGEALLFPGISK